MKLPLKRVVLEKGLAELPVKHELSMCVCVMGKWGCIKEEHLDTDSYAARNTMFAQVSKGKSNWNSISPKSTKIARMNEKRKKNLNASRINSTMTTLYILLSHP